MLSVHFLDQLDDAFKDRRIAEGLRLLEHAGVEWTSPDIERGGAAKSALVSGRIHRAE